MTTSVGLNGDPGFAEEVSPTVSVDHRFVSPIRQPGLPDRDSALSRRLVDVNIFDAFPDNPDATTNGSDNLLRSSRRSSTGVPRPCCRSAPASPTRSRASGSRSTGPRSAPHSSRTARWSVPRCQVEDLTSDEGLRAVLELYAEVLASQR